MTDYNRSGAVYSEPVNRAGAAYGSAIPTTGPIFGGLDFVAGIVAAVMVLGPLAMAAFWVSSH
jgi:hypothetical protein